MDTDQAQFFKDVGATAEQTVQEMRGVGENCFNSLEKTMVGFPLGAEIIKKWHSYAHQNIASALEFSRMISQAKDLQDFTRIQTEFMQSQFLSFTEQVRDFSTAYTKLATDKIKVPSVS